MKIIREVHRGNAFKFTISEEKSVLAISPPVSSFVSTRFTKVLQSTLREDIMCLYYRVYAAHNGRPLIGSN